MSETDPTTSETSGPAPAGNRFARAHHMLLYFLGAAAAIWLLSGFYQVRADQVAIVERLGQYLPGQVEHGLHYHLPWPIDRVHVISTQQRLTLAVKAFNASPAEYDDFKRQYMNNPDNPYGADPRAINAIFNPYLISSDKSVLHMEVTVQFRVRDPEKWLQAVSHEYSGVYNPDDPTDMRNALLQQIVQHAMIQQCGRVPFESLLLEKREALPQLLQTLISDGLLIETTDATIPSRAEEIDFGLQVLSVQVTALRPPDAVKPAFDQVLAMRAGRDTAESMAQADANGMLTRAKGDTETLIVDANAYKSNTIQAATGEANRFKQVLAQYLNAPDVTRWNLYVDSKTTVTGNAKRIFLAIPGQRTYITLDPAEYDPNQVKPAGN
jgi:membrane protease subunit HflK